MSPAIHRETHRHRIDHGRFEAYVAWPEGPPRPAVLLAHDWSGLHDGIREIADRLAGGGHAVFAFDVYGEGVRGDPLGDNHALMNPLLADRGLLRARLLGAMDVARRHPAIDGSRCAALGFCFGGLCVLDLVRAQPAGLRGVISVHGALAPPSLGEQRPIDARVLLLHGWEDPVAPPSDVLAITAELTAAGADWELRAYGHAMHAFTFAKAAAPAHGLAFHPIAAARAWAAIDGCLAELLRSTDDAPSAPAR